MRLSQICKTKQPASATIVGRTFLLRALRTSQRLSCSCGEESIQLNKPSALSSSGLLVSLCPACSKSKILGRVCSCLMLVCNLKEKPLRTPSGAAEGSSDQIREDVRGVQICRCCSCANKAVKTPCKPRSSPTKAARYLAAGHALSSGRSLARC